MRSRFQLGDRQNCFSFVALCGSQGTAGRSPEDRVLRALRRGGRRTARYWTGRPAGKVNNAFWKLVLPRKEVIQPHVPVRLPCYDFTPLTLHTFGTSLPEGLGRRLRVQTTRVGGVTGGVYKARERIHRGVLIRDY